MIAEVSIQDLKNCELFSELDSSELERVNSVLTRRLVPTGEFIIHEGTEAVSLFAVERGAVDVVKEGADGARPRITELHRGETFGEISMLGQPPRTAGVVAHEETEIVELPYGDLERLAKDHPKLGVKLYKALASSLGRKTRNTTNDLVSLIAASRMAALGEMSTSIAHEINNPLSIIALTASLLQRLVLKPQAEQSEILERINEISATAQRIHKIIDSMKTLARNGELDPLETTPVRRLVADTLMLCRAKFDAAGVTLATDGVPEQLLLRCRPVQIAQVLLNLLNNAFDAVSQTPPRKVAITALERGEQVEIAISDNGTGVTAEARDKIFKPFFTTKKSGKGTGLGLSISRTIVESHGGRLFLDAHPGPTRFVLQLPK